MSHYAPHQGRSAPASAGRYARHRPRGVKGAPAPAGRYARHRRRGVKDPQRRGDRRASCQTRPQGGGHAGQGIRSEGGETDENAVATVEGDKEAKRAAVFHAENRDWGLFPFWPKGEQPRAIVECSYRSGRGILSGRRARQTLPCPHPLFTQAERRSSLSLPRNSASVARIDPLHVDPGYPFPTTTPRVINAWIYVLILFKS
jgi:hypothetical protein